MDKLDKELEKLKQNTKELEAMVKLRNKERKKETS